MKFLPQSDAERQQMLAAIGVSSIDDLFASVPAAVRQAPDLPAPLSEIEIRRFLGGLAARNASARDTAFFLGGGKEDLRFEMDAVSRVPARDAGLEERIEHIHADGTRHDHFNVGEQIGIYTAVVDFSPAGEWGVELTIDTGEKKQTLRPRFNVAAEAITVPIGADAPRSKNLTVADVTDLAQIDTSANPSPEMHTTTVAQAIEAKRPVLVLFAAGFYRAWMPFAIAYGLTLAVASYGVLTRRRWGWLMHIPLSLNMGMWAFNSVYVSNRWREFPWR